MTALDIRLLVGGRSTEHDASIGSMANVLDNVGAAIRVREMLYVPREGRGARRHRGPYWPRDEQALRDGEPLDTTALLTELGRPTGFVFHLLHGDEGEDGAWGGIAEVLDIAGSFESVGAASLTMSKSAQSALAEHHGIVRVPETWLLDGDVTADRLDEIVVGLGGAKAVTKPDAMGASHLTSLVAQPDRASLAEFGAVVAGFGIRGIVQRYVSGREVTCGVLSRGDRLQALPVIDAVTDAGFLGHDEKHVGGLVHPVVLPSDDESAAAAADASIRLFRLYGLTYMARFDFIWSDRELWFLEANSIPGFMAASAFPLMLDAAGLTIEDAILGLAATAARHRARRKTLIYDVHRSAHSA